MKKFHFSLFSQKVKAGKRYWETGKIYAATEVKRISSEKQKFVPFIRR